MVPRVSWVPVWGSGLLVLGLPGSLLSLGEDTTASELVSGLCQTLEPAALPGGGTHPSPTAFLFPKPGAALPGPQHLSGALYAHQSVATPQSQRWQHRAGSPDQG